MTAMRSGSYAATNLTRRDWVMVAALADGHRPDGYSQRELAMAIARLDSYGYSARFVADRIGVSTRTVTRYRARNRAGAWSWWIQ